MVELTLRSVIADDLPLVTGGASTFDDYGPRTPLTTPPPARLDESGGLTVESAGRFAGHLSWHYERWGPGAASRNPMLGIWLPPSHRGRGIGSAAQRQLAELFFRHTAVNRVEAATDVENIAEQRALERAGFTREGRIRGAHWRAGAYRDMYLYSVLRADLDAGRDPSGMS